jgi:hypothetical protein
MLYTLQCCYDVQHNSQRLWTPRKPPARYESSNSGRNCRRFPKVYKNGSAEVEAEYLLVFSSIDSNGTYTHSLHKQILCFKDLQRELEKYNDQEY